MAEPKKRMTSTRSGSRQSQDRLKSKGLTSCSHCKMAKKSHTVCQNCGYYKGKKILSLDKKAKQKETEQLKDE